MPSNKSSLKPKSVFKKRTRAVAAEFTAPKDSVVKKRTRTLAAEVSAPPSVINETEESDIQLVAMNPTFPRVGDHYFEDVQVNGILGMHFDPSNESVGSNDFATMRPVSCLCERGLVVLNVNESTAISEVWILTGPNSFMLIMTSESFVEKTMKFRDMSTLVPVATNSFLDACELNFKGITPIPFIEKPVHGSFASQSVVNASVPQYQFSMIDKSDSDEKKNISIVRVLGLSCVNSKVGKSLSTATKMNSDLFRQLTDLIPKEYKLFSFAKDCRIFSALLTAKFAFDAEKSEAKIGNTDMKILNGGVLPKDSASLTEFFGNLGRFFDSFFESNSFWLHIFGEIPNNLIKVSSMDASSFNFRLEKAREWLVKFSMCIRDDVFISLPLEDQKIRIIDLSKLSYVTKNDYIEFQLCHMQGKESKPQADNKVDTKKDKTKVATNTTPTAVVVAPQVATGLTSNASAGNKTTKFACFSKICLLAKTALIPKICPRGCKFNHGPDFSECSKSSNLKHFTGIAQKVWQSDPTGVALALTLIESFVESKFGCP